MGKKNIQLQADHIGKTVLQAKSGKVNRPAHNGKMTKMSRNLTSGLRDEPESVSPSPAKTVMVGQKLWSHRHKPTTSLVAHLSE